MFRLVARNAAIRWGHTHQDNWLLRAAVTSKRHMVAMLSMPILSSSKRHMAAMLKMPVLSYAKQLPPLTWVCCKDGNPLLYERGKDNFLPLKLMGLEWQQ